MPSPTEYLTVDEVADLLRVSKRELQRQRTARVGIPYVKLGSRVLYTRADVDAYVAANRFEAINEATV